MSSQKFRPYLSLSQLQYLQAKLAESTDPIATDLKLQFSTLLFKIEVGLAKPSYTSTGRKTVKDSLGFTYQDELEAKYLNGELTPEEELQYESNLMNTTKGI